MGRVDGLNRYLLDQAKFEDVCWKLTPSLDVVPTSELRQDSAELLHGNRMRAFLAEASANYGVVLLDGPPMFPIVDAQVLSHLVDGVLLVVRAHRTPFDLAKQAADFLKPKLVGTILNGADRLMHNKYYSNYTGRTEKK
jgi:Mrp family chromosome partitioning ATPase